MLRNTNKLNALRNLFYIAVLSFPISCVKAEYLSIDPKNPMSLISSYLMSLLNTTGLSSDSLSLSMISAILYDENGNPLANAKMDINSTSSNFLSRAFTTVYTDSDGMYEISAGDGTLTISVTKSDGTAMGSFFIKVEGEKTPTVTNNNSSFQSTEPQAMKQTSSNNTANTTPSQKPNIAYSSASYTILTGQFTLPVIPRNSGGKISICTVSPSLPIGLSVKPTSCTIAGTPTISTTSKAYQITATNSVGSITVSISLAVVNPDPPQSLRYSGSPFTFTKGQSVAISPSYVGGKIKSCTSSSSLAAIGLILDPLSCRVFGVVSVSQNAVSYTITASNGSGNVTGSLSIAVEFDFVATINITAKIKDSSGNAFTPTSSPSAAVKYISINNLNGSSILASTDTVKDFSTASIGTDHGNFTVTFRVNAATGTLVGRVKSCTSCSTTANSTTGLTDYDSIDKYTTDLGTFTVNLNLAATGGTDTNQVTLTNASGLTITVVSVNVSIKGKYNLVSPTLGENICDGKNVTSAGENLSGAISGNKSISGSANLSGTLTVESGATLTVTAGTVIFGNRGSSIFVKQGGKLIAEGTANNPICFTSAQSLGSRYPGDWGGIVLIGNGRTTRATASTTEGTIPITYGNGTNDADSSGSLKYVIIEFTGTEVAPGDELNGLSMYAVGSGTTIDYVQVHRGLDDSFEMWGGAVNLTHVVSTGAQDDDFDMDEGYAGSITYAVGQKYPASCGGSPSTDPHGIESDGTNSGGTCSTGTAARCTNGTLSYMTMLGQGITSGEAARLREGNAQTLSNSVFYSFAGNSSGIVIVASNTSSFPVTTSTINSTVYLQSGYTVATGGGTDNSQKILSAAPVTSIGDVANCGFGASKPDFTTNTSSGAPSSVGASANNQGSWWSGWTVYRAR